MVTAITRRTVPSKARNHPERVEMLLKLTVTEVKNPHGVPVRLESFRYDEFIVMQAAASRLSVGQEVEFSYVPELGRRIRSLRTLD